MYGNIAVRYYYYISCRDLVVALRNIMIKALTVMYEVEYW